MLKSSGAMSAAILTSRVLGMVREMVYARFMGDGPVASAFKLAFTELRNRLGDLAMHLLDRASLSLDDIGDLRVDEQMRGRFWALSMTIAAGSSQVQRNIVAERILGLPRDR
jgi:alkylation response protein AidB-like acyl-CoA dehydrogenase